MGIWSSSPRWDIQNDIPNLRGKVVVVTGGNTGLGLATIQHLVGHGAKIYMGARTEERAKAAIAKLDLTGEESSVEWLELNLGDPREAKKAAERFLEKEERLDILVNNAGVTVIPYNRAQDDIQDVMMINHISPFVFTNTLLPLMKKTAKEEGADVRIVNIASAASTFVSDTIRYRDREDFNDEHCASWTSGLERYGRSKLANILFAKELQRHFDEQKVPILSLSLHPGNINTEGYQNIAKRQGWLLRTLITFAVNYFMTTADKGAYTQVFAAVAPVVREQAEKYKGAFLMPPAQISNPTKPAENKELAKELWETTEALLKEMGVGL